MQRDRHGKFCVTDRDRRTLASCRYIVFSGGAAKSVAMASAFKSLRELYASAQGGKDLCASLKGAAGTSAGAALALAACCAADDDVIRRFVTDRELWNLGQFVASMDLFRFYQSRGLCDHSVIYKHVDRLLTALSLPADIDFVGLRAATGKDFACNSVCAEDDSMLIMSCRHTPYLRIRDALCMSMCVPFYVMPFEYDGKEYLDGGLYHNYHRPDWFPEDETMGIAVDNTPTIQRETGTEGERKNGILWAASLISTMCTKINALHDANLSEEMAHRTIRVRTPGFEGTVLHVNGDRIEALWKYGELSVAWHFMRTYFVSCLLLRYIGQKVATLGGQRAEEPGEVADSECGEDVTEVSPQAGGMPNQ